MFSGMCFRRIALLEFNLMVVLITLLFRKRNFFLLLTLTHKILRMLLAVVNWFFIERNGLNFKL